jgi:carboxypeptidase PM20D1
MGHDEEINGMDGARQITQVLKSRGVRAEFVLDEGAFVVANMLPGLERPIALICNCEKGAVDLKLTVDTFPPSHSSSPPAETNIGVLARAITRLEAHPFGIDTSFVVSGLHSIATALPLPHRVILANMWFFGPIVRRVAAGDPQLAMTSRFVLEPPSRSHCLPY